MSAPIGSGAVGSPPTTPFQQAYNNYLTYNSPTFGQYQGSVQNGYNQIGYQNALNGLNQGDLQTQYQSNLGDNQTQIDVNGLQQGRSLADAAAYAQMQKLNWAAFNAQAAGMQNDLQKNLFGINSQATANGAYTSQGAGLSRGFAQKDYESQLANAFNQNAQQDQLLGMRGGNATVQAQILARESQNLGMKSGQLQTTLTNGLAKLGLQNQMTVGNLLDGINSGNLQAQQLYNQIIQQAGQYATAAGTQPTG